LAEWPTTYDQLSFFIELSNLVAALFPNFPIGGTFSNRSYSLPPWLLGAYNYREISKTDTDFTVP
jgi:hypothetical protein